MLTSPYVEAKFAAWEPIAISRHDQFFFVSTKNYSSSQLLLVTAAATELAIWPDPVPMVSNPEYCDLTFETQWEWTKFQSLKGNWLKERSTSSSVSEGAMSPSYQRIIAMGPLVIPMIFREMVCEGDDPDQWFWALQALTGADPVTDEMRGDYLAMSKAWLAWGRKQGYAW